MSLSDIFRRVTHFFYAPANNDKDGSNRETLITQREEPGRVQRSRRAGESQQLVQEARRALQMRQSLRAQQGEQTRLAEEAKRAEEIQQIQEARRARREQSSRNSSQYVTQSGNILENARDFVIDQANFYTGVPLERLMSQEERRAAEAREAEEAKQVLEKLAAHGMPGAMLDAQEREFAPKCNEDTRRTLRRELAGWGEASEVRRVIWLSGPAAVGKSAVAQTVAEELKAIGLLGGVYFFSRPNNRSNPKTLIPTLAYQLALVLPDYLRILTRRFIRDPLILERSRRSQFEELITIPFLFLGSDQHLVIVLDGLDECISSEAQRDFIEMIVRSAQMHGCGLRLRWIICSRPEPVIRIVFSTSDSRAVCIFKKLEVDDGEAKEDASRIFDKGFAEIRNQYPDQVGLDWPSEDAISFLTDRASGHLGFVAFLLRFIGDNYYANPSGQLKICLKFLEHLKIKEDLNPLSALDTLYTQILVEVPSTTLPTTQRILRMITLYNNKSLTAVILANILGLDRATFYSSLQRLHSVLIIPPVSEAAEKPVLIYHASFSDYLRAPSRSGTFALNEGVVHLDIASLSLDWLRYGRRVTPEPPLPELTWVPTMATPNAILNDILLFLFAPCWKSCIRVSQSSVPKLLEKLREYDFDLAYVERWERQTEDFANFIHWLVSLESFEPGLETPFSPGFGSNAGSTSSSSSAVHPIQVRHQTQDYNTFLAPFPLRPKTLSGMSGLSLYVDLRLNETAFRLALDRYAPPMFSYSTKIHRR